MESIEIKRPVVIKAIMTESFRSQILQETTDTWKNHENAFNQLEAMYQKTKAAGSLSNPSIEKQIELERARLGEIKKEMDARVNEFKSVPNDQEVVFRVMEGPATIKVGDDLQKFLSSAEIVIKDWKVIEFRGF